MKRIEIQLTDEDAALLTHLAGGRRRQSLYVGQLLREAAGQQTLRSRVDDLAAQVERLRAELAVQEGTPDGR